MPPAIPAKILRLHASESDKYNGKPLHEAIASKCRDMNIAGVTVFRAHEGFGETAEMHTHHLVASNQPIVLVVVDTAENIARIEPVLAEMMDTGAIAISDVQMIRVQKGAPSNV